MKFKLARILPLLKGKDLDATNPASYHPVSQLPVIAKLAERTVQRQLLKYLETNKLLSPQHHAYRDLHNTTTALLELKDAIATSTDNNCITTTMNIDLTAAFDCVPHGLLIDKLRYYGLDVHTIDWIESYLTGRSSFVSIGSANSFIRPTPQEVPQGSVLGPLLYLIFVNELTSIVNNSECQNQVHGRTDRLFTEVCQQCGTFPMYADDGQFQYSSNSRANNQDKIESTFWTIKNFLNTNGLLVNESKTILVEFMSHQKRSKTRGLPPDLTVPEETVDRLGRRKMQDRLISDKGGCRMLGLNLKNSQSWDEHMCSGKKAILPTMRKQIGLLSRITQNMSKSARLKLVNALVLSRMSYMICIWGNNNSSQIRKAQVVMNMAGKLVTGFNRFARQKDILDSCGWLEIRKLTEYFTLCQLWKIIKWGAPLHLRNKITYDEDNNLVTERH